MFLSYVIYFPSHAGRIYFLFTLFCFSPVTHSLFHTNYVNTPISSFLLLSCDSFPFFSFVAPRPQLTPSLLHAFVPLKASIKTLATLYAFVPLKASINTLAALHAFVPLKASIETLATLYAFVPLKASIDTLAALHVNFPKLLGNI